VTLDAVSTISVSGNLTINSNLTGTGGLTKTLAAFVPLNGTNNDYTGPTTISAGGLTIKSSLYGNDTSKWIPDNITVNSGGALVLNVGGAGEFTIAQAGTMFSQLGGAVDNNGLKAGSVFGVDTRTAGGSFTITDNLIDSSGPGGGAVGFRYVGNGTLGASTLELTGANTYSGLTIVDRSGTIKVSSLNSVNGGSPPLASSSLGRPTTVANGKIQTGTKPSFQGGGRTYTGTGETTDRVLNLGGANGTTYRLDQSGTGLLKFTSPFTITDNRGVKTIVLQGSTVGTGEISSSILNGDTANPNRLTKSGSGTWTLSGANAFVGITTVDGGALVLANAEALKGGIGATGGSGALTFNGGVIGLGAGDFARPLAAANTVGAATFTGNGGWAAYGADRAVNLGGASATITWATAGTGFNGKTLILGNATATHMVTLQNPLDLGAATRTVQVDDGAAAIDGALSGALAGTAGGLTKTGLGTLSLTANNGYAGATTVSSGTLLVNNTTGSGTGTSDVSVNLGALGGTGSISGAVTIGDTTGVADAILAPGSSVGAIATGNLTFNSDGGYACELNGTSVTSDRANVTGTVAIDAATTLTVSLTGSLAGNQKYFIVVNDDTDAVTGIFSGLAQDAVVGTFGGTDLKISYTGDSGTSATTGGNDIVLYTTSSSPYGTWAAGTFANPFTNSSPGVDFDKDGLSNLMEFVLGGDPTISQAGIAPKASVSGSNLVLTFKRSDVSELAPAVTVKVELSTDLSFSTPADDIIIGPATDPGPIAPSGASYTVSNSGGFDTITVTIPQVAAPKKFARVKAVQP